jgi:hypothetical protein
MVCRQRSNANIPRRIEPPGKGFFPSFFPSPKIIRQLTSIQVLEFCKFQPGLFVNYFTFPHRSAKYLAVEGQFNLDFENRRAIVIEGTDPHFTLTTIQDLARVVSAAIDYEGVWPETGGIRGEQLTISQFLSMGAKIRGKAFDVDYVKKSDLEQGKLESSWIPAFGHPSVPKEQWEEFGKVVIIGSLLAIDQGAWNVSDEWNQLLPDLKLEDPEELLARVWKGKP